MTEINYDLLATLAVQPHPLLNPEVCDCHHWCGEINQEAKVSHHLLDICGVPRGEGYAQNLDSRTWLLAHEFTKLHDRLSRIAGWHKRVTAPAGTFDNYCVECGMKWPCDTRRMADGTHEDLE